MEIYGSYIKKYGDDKRKKKNEGYQYCLYKIITY